MLSFVYMMFMMLIHCQVYMLVVMYRDIAGYATKLFIIKDKENNTTSTLKWHFEGKNSIEA